MIVVLSEAKHPDDASLLYADVEALRPCTSSSDWPKSVPAGDNLMIARQFTSGDVIP